jgi:hypothetical protein
MKSSYCLGIIVMLAGVSQAQFMHGTIEDAVIKKPIPGATITVVEISKTCTTDSVGYYSTGIVPAGMFNATISAPDYLMSFRRVFIASPKGPGISRIKFSTGLYHISSAADTSKGTMSLTYRFPGQGDIEITIKNGIGKTIRKMYDRSRAGGMRTVSWNGRDDYGNVVPAGRYTYKISSGRLVIIRSLDWKGETDMPPPVPASAIEVWQHTEETPAEPPAVPAPDTTAPVRELENPGK